jgi:hypothetical protein
MHVNAYIISILLLLFWAFLAVTPVVTQLRWGLWVALIAAGTEAGLLFLYGSMCVHGLPDGHAVEFFALWYGLWATLIGGGLATCISFSKYIRTKYISNQQK